MICRTALFNFNQLQKEQICPSCKIIAADHTSPQTNPQGVHLHKIYLLFRSTLLPFVLLSVMPLQSSLPMDCKSLHLVSLNTRTKSTFFQSNLGQKISIPSCSAAIPTGVPPEALDYSSPDSHNVGKKQVGKGGS